MAQFADRNGRLISPMLEQLRRRRVSQQEKGVAYKREGWTAVEEANFFQFMSFSARDAQPMCKGKFALTVDQMWSQFGDLAVEFDHLRTIIRGEFESRGVPPAGQPVKQFQIRQNHRLATACAD